MTGIQQLQKFINDHDDWQERLGKEPYHIRSPKVGNLRLFTYTQGATDFSIPMCRVCRGLILEEGTWKVISAQFKKFFNYFDKRYFKEIGYRKYDTYIVEEKYDGSLIRLYWYDGEWKIGTNGSILASRIDLKFVDDNIKTFEDVIYDILSDDFDKLTSRLHKSFTYIFELIHPYQPITINYQDEKSLIFHGMTKNDAKFIELDIHSLKEPDISDIDSIKYPSVEHIFYHSGELDYDQLAMYAESKEGLNEGYVVKRVNYLGVVVNRVKVKLDEYLQKSDLALYSYDKLIFKHYFKGTIDYFLNNTDLSPYQYKLVDVSIRKINLIKWEYIELLKEFDQNRTLDKKKIALEVMPELNHPFKNVIFHYVDYIESDEYKSEILKSNHPRQHILYFVDKYIRNIRHPSKYKQWWEGLIKQKNHIYFPNKLDKLLYDELHYNEID